MYSSHQTDQEGNEGGDRKVKKEGKRDQERAVNKGRIQSIVSILEEHVEVCPPESAAKMRAAEEILRLTDAFMNLLIEKMVQKASLCEKNGGISEFAYWATPADEQKGQPIERLTMPRVSTIHQAIKKREKIVERQLQLKLLPEIETTLSKSLKRMYKQRRQLMDYIQGAAIVLPTQQESQSDRLGRPKKRKVLQMRHMMECLQEGNQSLYEEMLWQRLALQ